MSDSPRQEAKPAKGDAAEKPEKTGKPDKPEKGDHPERAEKGEGGAKSETASAPAGAPAFPILLAVTAAALLGGAAIGDFLVAPRIVAASRARPEAKPAADAEAPEANRSGSGDSKADKGKKSNEKPATYRMDNIIVNPAGSNGTRFLMASVAVEVSDKTLQAAMKERDAELRDAVISALERQSLEVLLKQGARDTLRHEIEASIERVMNVPVRVFLPQFVVQ